jgi:hypothetical protein
LADNTPANAVAAQDNASTFTIAAQDNASTFTIVSCVFGEACGGQTFDRDPISATSIWAAQTPVVFTPSACLTVTSVTVTEALAFFFQTQIVILIPPKTKTKDVARKEPFITIAPTSLLPTNFVAFTVFATVETSAILSIEICVVTLSIVSLLIAHLCFA